MYEDEEREKKKRLLNDSEGLAHQRYFAVKHTAHITLTYTNNEIVWHKIYFGSFRFDMAQRHSIKMFNAKAINMDHRIVSRSDILKCTIE